MVSKLGLWAMEQGPELEKKQEKYRNMDRGGKTLTDSVDNISCSFTALERALHLLEAYSKVVLGT